MAITETQRFEMHLGLRTTVGDNVADILMEHLPPSGWGDVARKSDIEHLDFRINNIDSRIKGVIAGMWAMGSIMCAGFIGLFAVIATKF